ncbi:MAG: cell division protein ZipA C-terminal FtsZ-binding domain-containing protein [Proteobacteria bacterium]|nr:cell division protein ZipA C-terminal FtsZ-binding domain-containing protein [Pseudomonadota bacterium]
MAISICARCFVVKEPAFRVEPRAERRIEPGFDQDEVDALDAPEPRRVDFDDESDFESPAIGRREPTLTSTRTDSVPTLRPEPPTRVEPTLSAHPPRRPSRRSPCPSRRRRPAPKRPQKILAIRVTASAPARFDGAQLLAALRAEGLGFGRYEIFHCLHEDGRPVYSVASLREPGTFDIDAMPTTYYPGIAMFAVLPGPVPAAEAFDEMIFSARALATHLSGSLTDERGAPLTTLRVGKLREEALEFERGAGPA